MARNREKEANACNPSQLNWHHNRDAFVLESNLKCKLKREKKCKWEKKTFIFLFFCMEKWHQKAKKECDMIPLRERHEMNLTCFDLNMPFLFAGRFFFVVALSSSVAVFFILSCRWTSTSGSSWLKIVLTRQSFVESGAVLGAVMSIKINKIAICETKINPTSSSSDADHCPMGKNWNLLRENHLRLTTTVWFLQWGNCD